jgi:outer membrane murein-binding lipoprotein Lpp
MSRIVRGVVAGASAVTLAGVASAQVMDTEEMAARIAELESRVAQLSGGEQQLTEQRAEEIRDLVQDVLADADTRASLLQSGMSSGYDDGFVIGSSDGMFSLKINALMQARVIYNNQDTNGTGDDNRFGFENTRTRLVFSGNVGEQWHYNIQGTYSPYGTGDAGDLELEDAYMVYDYGGGWMSAIGQFRAPTSREWLVSEGEQLAVERSLVSYLHNAVYVQGIAMGYKQDSFRAMGALSNGAQGGANGSALQLDTEFSFSARAEFLLSGAWEQFEDFTSPMGSESGLLIGGSFHWEKGEFGTAATNELEVTQVTGDVSWENDGWNVYGGIYYTNWDTGTGGIDLDTLGLVVQGGLYLNQDWELFGRYEYEDFDVTGVDELSIITFGVNRYYGANAKWTTDVGVGINGVIGASGVTGYRNDALNQDGQIVIRSQMQLSF